MAFKRTVPDKRWSVLLCSSSASGGHVHIYHFLSANWSYWVHFTKSLALPIILGNILIHLFFLKWIILCQELLNFNGQSPKRKNKLVSKEELSVQGSVSDFFHRSWNKVDLWVISTQTHQIDLWVLPFIKNDYGLSIISEVPLFIALYTAREFHTMRDMLHCWCIHGYSPCFQIY